MYGVLKTPAVLRELEESVVADVYCGRWTWLIRSVRILDSGVF
jgi:hypothetical protein